MFRASRPALTLFATAVLAVTAVPVFAQQQPSPQQPKSAPQAKSQPQQAQPKAAQPQAQPKAETAPQTADTGLRLRVEQLEEQLVDMQVVVGTLESMSRGGSGPSGAGASASGRGPMSAADAQRMEQLEGQVRQLQAQVEQMAQQLRGQGAIVSAAPPAAPSRIPPRGGFETQVTPSERDPIGQIIGSQSAPPRATIPAPIPGQANEPTPGIPQAQASDASSKQLYETSYGLLLQQDYGAAEAAFDEFLRRFPSDPLAGNAQYWLGETYFVRGQYKQAAGAFLKGYQAYQRSSKAPDSLLKLAMSLDRLGQRDAACSSYGELAIKYPNAPGAVKNRADNERRRLGCQ